MTTEQPKSEKVLLILLGSGQNENKKSCIPELGRCEKLHCHCPLYLSREDAAERRQKMVLRRKRFCWQLACWSSSLFQVLVAGISRSNYLKRIDPGPGFAFPLSSVQPGSANFVPTQG